MSEFEFYTDAEFEFYTDAEIVGEVVGEDYLNEQFILPVRESFGEYRWKSKIHHVVIEVDDVVMGTLNFKKLTAFQKKLKSKDFEGHWVVVHVFKGKNEFHFTIAFDH